MTRDPLYGAMKELFDSINLLHKSRLQLPSMMMCFATIDILAALARPDGKDESDSSDFRDWVKRYLLPDSNLVCSADDLWAARCGLLHTYTPEARDTRKGKARKMLYVSGVLDDAARGSLQFSVGEYVIVVSQDFFNAISAGLLRFVDELKMDSALHARVSMRANEFLVPFTLESR